MPRLTRLSRRARTYGLGLRRRTRLHNEYGLPRLMGTQTKHKRPRLRFLGKDPRRGSATPRKCHKGPRPQWP